MQIRNDPRGPARRGSAAGFTLIELLVVITIMGILAAVVVANVVGGADDAKVERVHTDFSTLKGAVVRFKVMHNRYPESFEELVTGPEHPHTGEPTSFIEDLPYDPWSGQPYEWDTDDRGVPFFKSYGEDQAEGGEAYAKDIISNEQKVPR